MRLGRVVGAVWSTKKCSPLNGYKLLLVETVQNGTESLWVCADVIGAGAGERVIIATGSAARLALGDGTACVDQAVVGIVDDLEFRGGEKDINGKTIFSGEGT